MTQSNKVFVATILMMGLVLGLTTGGAIFFLYRTAVQEQKGRLLEVVKSQAQFIEILHEINSDHGSGMGLSSHMSHADELDDFFVKLAELLRSSSTAETHLPVLQFFIAEKDEENVRFHMGSPKLMKGPVPYEKLLGKPMGMALQGNTDVLKTRDHMGSPILCSFTYVPSVGMGIVAKLLLKDLRRPFVRSALFTCTGALVLLLLSGLVMKKRVSPLVTRLEEQHLELKYMNEHLHTLATTDALTQLFNRQHFNEQIHAGLLVANRYHRSLSLILMDIDHFKNINDSLGHLTGDTVLNKISGLLQNRVRKSDIVARWGGEEFAVLLNETGEEDACSIARELCDTIAAHDFDVDLQVTCSFGVAVYTRHETTEALIGRADQALYQAKRAGRNQVVFQAYFDA